MSQLKPFRDMPRITVGVPTKERYDSLLTLLNSLLLQSYKNFDLIIVDDSSPDKRPDLRQIPIFAHIFNMFNRFGIGWEILFGEGKGQVNNHIKVLEKSKNLWVLRVDDDHVLEPDCIDQLASHLFIDDNEIRAIAPRVVHSDKIFPMDCVSPYITDVLSKYALQFTEFNDTREVEHYYSTFMGRKDLLLDCYPRNLSKIGHREDSIVSYNLFKKGHKLLVDGSAIVYHFRMPTGGIRSYQNPLYWENDEKVFKEILRKDRIKLNTYKLVCCNGGIGDQMILRGLLPKIREKHKNEKIFFACVYPAFMEGEQDIELASIAGAQILFGPEHVDKLDPYRLGYELNGEISLINAYKKIYGI